jgi:hypothetical protein
MAKKQQDISPDLGLGPARENETQSRTVGNFLRSSDYDTIVEAEQTMTQHGHNPEKLHRCVNKVKAKGGGGNPWAICNASIHG